MAIFGHFGGIVYQIPNPPVRQLGAHLIHLRNLSHYDLNAILGNSVVFVYIRIQRTVLVREALPILLRTCSFFSLSPENSWHTVECIADLSSKYPLVSSNLSGTVLSMTSFWILSTGLYLNSSPRWLSITIRESLTIHSSIPIGIGTLVDFRSSELPRPRLWSCMAAKGLDSYLVL